MGVEAFPALVVLEPNDEVPGLSLLRRCDQLILAGIRPPVADVIADRAVQQARVLCHHGDDVAQAVLRDRADVLPVDGDPTALDVEEAQQQVDQRRLARARVPDQPDFLTRPDRQVQVLHHCFGLAVVEGHALERDGALGNVQIRRAGLVDDFVGHSDRLPALGHRSCALENMPQQPQHHAREPRQRGHQRQCGGDGPRRRTADRPQPQAQASGEDHQKCIENDQHRRHQHRPPHHPDPAEVEVIDGLGDVAILHALVGEQLDGLNVGIAVDNAARDL